MSNWVEIEEEGHTYYVNEDLGNIIKITDNLYVSCMPKVVKLGPFGTLEEAKAAFDHKSDVESALEEVNNKLIKG
jgi:glycine cleavage system H lipoate-binding protein